MYKEIMSMYEPIITDSENNQPSITDRPTLEDINMKDAETIRVYLSFLDQDINDCNIDLNKY